MLEVQRIIPAFNEISRREEKRLRQFFPHIPTPIPNFFRLDIARHTGFPIGYKMKGYIMLTVFVINIVSRGHKAYVFYLNLRFFHSFAPRILLPRLIHLNVSTWCTPISGPITSTALTKEDLSIFANIDTRTNLRALFFNNHIYRIASMPEVISDTSRVMAAWRTLLNVRGRLCAISLALSVALFIATMRAECSEALFSRSAWNTAMLSRRGKSTVSTESASGSMVYAAGCEKSSLCCGAYLPLAGRIPRTISRIISG